MRFNLFAISLALLLALFVSVPAMADPPPPLQPVSVIDLLILYTPQARDGAGGTSAILANIDLAVLEANTVFQNSHANARIRLVHVEAINYTESGSVATDLAALKNPLDLNLGQASHLRDQYGADLVCLITETGGDYDFYGLQGPSAANAFSILRRPFLTGLYYLPVNLAFNFGCQLERPYADSSAAFPYAYGYSFYASNTLYSTADAFSGQRLPFLSNPDIIYQGVAAGVPINAPYPADNALVINHTAPIVAAFRGTAPNTYPPVVRLLQPSGDTNSPLPVKAGTNLTLEVAASDSDGFVSRVNYYVKDTVSGVAQFLGITTNSPFSFVWTNVPAGSWQPFAQAVDNFGAATRADSANILLITAGNDNLANAAPLAGANIYIVGTTLNATLESGEPDWNNGQPSVWYSWTAPANGRVTLSAVDYFGLDFSACTGDSVTNLNILADNQAFYPSIDFPVQAGSNYLVIVAGTQSLSNSFLINLAFQTAPANDDFENRAVLANDGSVSTANNFAASFQPDEPDTAQTIGVGGSRRTLWWTWTAPADGQVTFNASGDFDFVEGIYQGEQLTNLTLSAWYFTEQSPLTVSAGDTCQIVVDGFNGSAGNIQLSAAFVHRPVNDDFTNRTTISGTSITLTNSSVAAKFDPYYAYRLWYSWTAPVSGYVTISCPSGQYVNVYTGSVETNLTDFADGAPASFEAVAGTTYTIAATIIYVNEVILNLDLSTLQLTSPANNSAFNEGDNIPFTISSTANDATIAQIQFFASRLPVGSVTNPPYSFVWSNAPRGNFTMQAVATTVDGRTLLAPPISIVVSNNPILRITSPTNGANFLQGANITVTAIKTPSSGPLGQVAFYASGIPLGTVSQPPYSVIWSNAPVGSYAIMAVGANPSVYTNFSTYTHNTTPINIQVNFPIPVNDGFTNAKVLTGATISTNGTTSGASTEPGEFVPSSDSYGSVWYSWTAPVTGAYHVNLTAGYVWPYGLRIYTGTNLANLSLVNLLDNANYGTSYRADFIAQAGTTYSFGVLQVGDFTLQIDPVPANNDFTNATILNGLSIATNGDNTYATVTPIDPFPGAQGQSVWYSWTAPASGLATISVASSNFPPRCTIYSGATVSNLTAVVAATTTQKSFTVTANTTYKIQVDGNGAGGAFTLNLSLALPPANDNFVSRQKLYGIAVAITGHSFLSDLEPGEPNNFLTYTFGGSVWYSWVAPADGVVELSCSNPVGIFLGDSVSNLTYVAASDGYATFSVTQGAEYQIDVDSSPSNSFTLSLVLPKAQFVSPTNGTYFPAPAAFKIGARTIDLNGQVISVSFYDAANLLATITNSPFQFYYTNVMPGIHQLTLQATDENGTITTNVPIQVFVRPQNDDFVQRSAIDDTTNILADNSAATTEPGESLPGGAAGKTLWWTWQAPTNGTVTIRASAFSPEAQMAFTSYAGGNARPHDVIQQQPNFGPPGPIADAPLIAVYTNSTLANLSLCASNSGFFLLSYVILPPPSAPVSQGDWYVLPTFTFPAVAGQNYQISVDGINGSFGVTSLNFDFAPVPSPPTAPLNDNFSQRTVLPGVSPSASGTTIAATSEPGEPLAGNYTNAQTVWFSWTANATGIASVQEVNGILYSGTGPGAFDLGVYTGSQLNDLIPVATGAGAIPFYVKAGTVYQISVASAAFIANSFQLFITGPPSPPAGTLQKSGMLPDGTFQLNLTGATGQSFAIQASSNLVDWTTIDIDTMSDVNLAFVDTDGTNFVQRFYRIVPLDEFFDSPAFTLGPANDAFANRSMLNGTNDFVAANNQLATSEPGEFLSDGASGKTLWWSWTAPTNATVTLTTAGSSFGTPFDSDENGTRFITGPLVSVLSGNAVSGLSLIASNSIRFTTPNYYGSAAGPMLVYTNFTFEAYAGATYNIAVDGCNGSSGNFNLSLKAALHLPFFNGEAGLANGVYYLAATNGNVFGYYNYKFFPLIYHFDLGFESFTDANDSDHGAYLYDFTSQHSWYTTPANFPYIYDFTLNAWLYYYPDTTKPGHYTANPRYFFNYSTQKIFTQ